MKFALPWLALLALVGCDLAAPPVPVVTVAMFSHDPALRERTLVACRNNPGQLAIQPNCINAQQSAHLAMSGTGDFPRLDTSPPPANRR